MAIASIMAAITNATTTNENMRLIASPPFLVSVLTSSALPPLSGNPRWVASFVLSTIEGAT
jgi:hypothetical protein